MFSITAKGRDSIRGGQLAKITRLIDDGIMRPIVDRVFSFASTKEAMAYVEGGRARGKVVVSMAATT